MYQHILEETEAFVSTLFEKYCNVSFVFHNLHHTKNVVKRAKEIADHYELNKEEKAQLIIAAWFHDTGYLFTDPKIHEQKSSEIMLEFMQGKPVVPGFIEVIKDAILATKFPTSPQSLLQQTLCDADTYHLGTKAFLISNDQVFEELHLRDNNLTREQFDTKTLSVLRLHKFHTGYCTVLLSEGKEKNIDYVKKKISLK